MPTMFFCDGVEGSFPLLDLGISNNDDGGVAVLGTPIAPNHVSIYLVLVTTVAVCGRDVICRFRGCGHEPCCVGKCCDRVEVGIVESGSANSFRLFASRSGWRSGSAGNRGN